VNTAIILAAGLGTKVWPYGEFRQKCTLPVANTPIVRRLALSLKELGLGRLIVVTGHYGQQVSGAVVDIEGVELVSQSDPSGGTSSAVLAALPSGCDEEFLVIYGDVVVAVENLKKLIKAFKEADAEAAVLVQRLEGERPCDWICAGVSGDRLTGVEGHPRGGSHRLCGIYAFKPSALQYIRRNPGIFIRVPVGGMPPPEAELAQSVQIMLDEGRDVLAVECDEFFVDVDKPWHLLEANGRLVDYMARKLEGDEIAPDAQIHDSAEINGKVILGEGTRIGPRVVVNGTLIAGRNNNITNGAILNGRILIGDSCRISDYCLVTGHTSIGNRCIVGHGAEMSGVLMDKVYLYHYCEMFGVFGTATDIGAATVCGTLRFDDGDTVHRVKGRPEVPPIGANATYMGEFCRTGVNAIIMPGCKIGSYSVIGPGVILYEDVPSKTLILAKQELVKKEWGPERYGW
jgi:bifunctional UDP-N-acetylglucosamine pyrophosphorylase/glucosamine-1-phosphate N-acetyltransferase